VDLSRFDSGALQFFTSETLSNVVDLIAPMHVAGLCYFVMPAGLAQPKGLDLQKKFGCGYYLNIKD
jgi:hypothetical protein